MYHVAEHFKSGCGDHDKSLNRGDNYAKHVMKQLEEYKVASRTHDILPLEPAGVRFQVTVVKQDGNIRDVFQLKDMVCTCGALQLLKYLCLHMLVVCRRINSDHFQYVNDYYSTENYLGTYTADFNPIPGVSDWPEASELPPLFPPGSCLPSVVRPVPLCNKSAQATGLV